MYKIYFTMWRLEIQDQVTVSGKGLMLFGRAVRCVQIR